MILQFAFLILIACSAALQHSAPPVAFYQDKGEHILTPSMYNHSPELMIQVKDSDRVDKFVIETMNRTFEIKMAASLKLDSLKRSITQHLSLAPSH